MAITTLFVFLLANYFLYAVRPATFTIKNNCPYTVWPGILSGSGTSTSTGMEVVSQASATFTTSTPWSGRVWGRFRCSNNGGKFICASGDCESGQIPCNGAGAKPPATLVELTTAPAGTGKDFYDVSNVDGFNLPLAIVPQCRSGCSSTSCPVDINAQCPANLAVKDAQGRTVGCKSACLAFNKPEYCCTPPFSSPETCKPTNYSKFFKGLCPQAYSYAFDDQSSTFTCAGAPNYRITFCP